jgi:metal-responsive CopG/Arc/MetJ family transcriptional regulator
MYMKSIQVLFDERLLDRLDRDDEVHRDGRSAVLRRAALEYLRRKRRADVKEAYRKAYQSGGGLGAEFGGWETQGEWPAE